MLLTRATAACTYEGENSVMHLQCARYAVILALPRHCKERTLKEILLEIGFIEETRTT